MHFVRSQVWQSVKQKVEQEASSRRIGTSNCSLVAGVFTKNLVLHNESGDLCNTDSSYLVIVNVSGSKRKHDKIINSLNVGNEVTDRIVNEKESSQFYGFTCQNL